MRIPIARPTLGEAERRAVLEVLESGWVVQGPRVAEFEAAFGVFTGAPHCVATTSCTTALHLALILLGVGPGDEVIVPAFTWIASANVVEMQGARPVFVDIDLESFNLVPEKVAAAITPRTKAIMAVSLFGLCAPVEALLELGPPVIEDAACGFGAWSQGRHCGTLGRIGCFSFHPRKAITTGEGGMLVTADPELAARARSLRDHGASVSDLARHQGPRPYLLPDFAMLGYNYRMTDLQAALGVEQLRRAPEILAERRRLASRYDAGLRELGWLRPPAVPAGHVHGYQAYVALYQPERPDLANRERLHDRRNRLMERLEQAGVSTRPGTHAVHTQAFYRERYALRPEDFPKAWMAEELSVTLPLYPQMSEEEQAFVLAQLASGSGPD